MFKFIVETVKNTQEAHFHENIVSISKNKVKEKSKYAICLTEISFIHEIEDKYDLENKVKFYPKLLITSFMKENEYLLRKVLEKN